MEMSPSSLNQFRLCPERLRSKRAGLWPAMTDTDATLVGNLIHTYVEGLLKLLREGRALTTEDELRARQRALQGLVVGEESGVLLSSASSWQAARQRLSRALDQWLEWLTSGEGKKLLSTDRNKWLIEHEFFLTVQDHTFHGFIDWFNGSSIVDWKSGKQGEPWELQRYDMQTTTYAMAVVSMGLATWPVDCYFIYPNGKQKRGNGGLYVPELTTIKVTRTEDHAKALLMEVDAIHKLESLYGYEEKWPINPSGWWCSKKWCPMHSQCVGMHINNEE